MKTDIASLILCQILAFGIALLGPSFSMAAPKQQESKRKLGTNFNFEDMMVKGKYQYPDEAITSVEDEKALNDLLGVRKHFKDRLQQTSTRH